MTSRCDVTVRRNICRACNTGTVKDPTIHPLLSKQVMDCIQLDPDDRPESMEAVRKRLELTADLLENPPEAGTIIDEETMF